MDVVILVKSCELKLKMPEKLQVLYGVLWKKVWLSGNGQKITFCCRDKYPDKQIIKQDRQGANCLLNNSLCLSAN